MADKETRSMKKILISPAFTAPFVIIFVMLAFFFSRDALARQIVSGGEDINVFLVITVVQMAAIALPCIIYYVIKGKKLATPMFLSPLRPRYFVFFILVLLLFISGMLLIKYIYQITGAGQTSLSSYFLEVSDINGEVNPVWVIISLVITPAICEEFVCRGVVLSEYRKYGSTNAVIVSALCFAMLHFSLENFPLYFFAGVVLGFVTVTTRSIIAPILLHMASNLLSLYGSDAFLSLIINKNGVFFVCFILVIVFGLSLIFVVSRLEGIYYRTADKPPEELLPPASREHAVSVFTSPTFLAMIAVFIALTVLI